MAMVHMLSENTGISEDEIIDDFKRVYGEKGSLEYSFSVQELEMCRNMPTEQVRTLVLWSKDAFSRVRREKLKPYDGVKETLTWAAKQGIKVIGITNSPLFQAKRRLKHLYLDSLFFGLAGWEGHHVPDNYYLTRRIKQLEKEGKYSSRLQRAWSLSTEELKPSPIAYLRIINDLNTSHKITYVIGDSLFKDIAPALEIGAVGIWAKYGEQFDPNNFQTLLRITNWSPEKVSAVYRKDTVTPTFVVNAFSELQKIIQPFQQRLQQFF